MEYSLELEVDVPCLYLIELYEDPENLTHWQPEIADYSLLSGEQGKVGSRMRLFYNLNGRPVDFVQTITVRDPPNELASRLETPGILTTVTHRFADIGPESTFWRVECKYEFTNFLMKLIGYFVPQLFREQTWRFMHRLKNFAETQYRGTLQD